MNSPELSADVWNVVLFAADGFLPPPLTHSYVTASVAPHVMVSTEPAERPASLKLQTKLEPLIEEDVEWAMKWGLPANAAGTTAATTRNAASGVSLRMKAPPFRPARTRVHGGRTPGSERPSVALGRSVPLPAGSRQWQSSVSSPYGRDRTKHERRCSALDRQGHVGRPAAAAREDVPRELRPGVGVVGVRAPQAPHRDGRIGSVAERVGEHRPEVPVGAVAEQGAQKAVVVLGLRRLVRRLLLRGRRRVREAAELGHPQLLARRPAGADARIGPELVDHRAQRLVD